MIMLRKTILFTLFFLCASLISSPVHITGHSKSNTDRNEIYIARAGKNVEKPLNNKKNINCDPKMIIPGDPDTDPNMIIPGKPDTDPKMLIKENTGIDRKIRIPDKKKFTEPEASADE